ncbi:hypothetical protein [Nocardia testacea]|uniref:hypothetical protein n=1 Tax=Nocardia testacea TaxID=248551 RepID=UPI003A89E7C9
MGTVVNEMPGGRVDIADGSVAKPGKPADATAGEVNISGGRDVRAGSLQSEASGGRVPGAGDEGGVAPARSGGSPEEAAGAGKVEADIVRPAADGDDAVVGAGRSAESPEATAVPRLPGPGDVVVREPAAGAAKVTATPESAPARSGSEATPVKPPDEVKPAVNRPDAVGKALGYPDRAVSADASGGASKPPVVKSEPPAGAGAMDTAVQPSGESPAKSSVSAEELGRAAEDGGPSRLDAESADDSGVGTRSRDSEAVDGQEASSAGDGSEGADLAARYLREAHEVLARHAGTDWSLVSPEGLGWMIRQSGDGQESAAAMVEIIRRGDPKHRVLRWTQVMAMLVARDAGVGNMQAGRGRRWCFWRRRR